MGHHPAAGDELELVEERAVVGVGEGHVEVLAVPGQGQEEAVLGDLAGHRLEGREVDHRLGEIDAGDALLVGEPPDQRPLGGRPQGKEPGGKPRGSGGLLGGGLGAGGFIHHAQLRQDVTDQGSLAHR